MKTNRITPLISLLFITVLVVGITSLAVTHLPLQQTTNRKYVLSPSTIVKQADVIVFKDGDYAVAVDEKGQELVRSTNHTLVIQTAIDHVASLGGGIIFIKRGTYVVDTIRLEGVHDIKICGEGNNTKLVAAGVDTIVFKIGDRSDISKASQRIEIAYLMIDGSNQATEDTDPENVERRFGIEIATPVANATWDIYIHHCYIYNTGSDSIYIWGNAYVVIAHNVIENTRGFWAAIHNHGVQGVGYPGFTHNTIIIHNVIRNSAVSAIRHGKIIAYNYIFNCSAKEYGDYYGKATIIGGDPGSIIAHNVIENLTTGASGILTWRSGNLVMGNVIKFAGKYGIVAYYNIADRTPIQGHKIIGNIIMYSANVGIHVACDNNIIKGNTIIRPGNSGIQFSGDGANNNIVEGNVIIDPSYPYNGYNGHGIFVYGNNNIIRDNRLIVTDTENIRPETAIYVSGDYNIIEDNFIQDGISFRQAVMNITGINNKVKGNHGYVTENSGVVVIPAGTKSVLIDHGLSVTPNVVIVTTNDTSVSAAVVSIDSTSFNVTLSTTPSTPVLVYWHAEYKP